MQPLSLSFLATICVILVRGSASATACNADNCLRAVRASKSLARGSADCSSFFKYTVTPATVTFTDTITKTSTTTSTETDTTVVTTKTTTTLDITVGQNIVARQLTASPSAIPAYASPCSGALRYSSACSCLGITPTSITVAAPSTTVFETVFVTETVIEATTLTQTSVEVTTATNYICPASLPSQVVVNPGFEQGLAPWTRSDAGGSVTLRLTYCGVNNPGADCDFTGAGCACGFNNADSPGGTGTLSQILNNVCPFKPYAFTAYIGISDNVIQGSAVEIAVSAYLDDVQLFAPFFPCGNPNVGCQIDGGSGNYLKVGPITVTPNRITPVLQLRFVSTIDPSKFSLDVFVDDITLTRL